MKPYFYITHFINISCSCFEAFFVYIILNPMSPYVQVLSHMFGNSFFWICKCKKFITMAPGTEEYRSWYVGEDKLLLKRIFNKWLGIIIEMLHCCTKYLRAFMVIVPQDQLILKATWSLLDKNVEPETDVIISCNLISSHSARLGGMLDCYRRKQLPWPLKSNFIQ